MFIILSTMYVVDIHLIIWAHLDAEVPEPLLALIVCLEWLDEWLPHGHHLIVVGRLTL